MTLDALVPLLRCPACGGALAYEPVPQRDTAAGACGALRCACAAYPVLDEIPILRSGPLDHRSIADDRVVAPGPTPADVLARVRRGRGLDALVDLLSFPVCPWPLNRVGAARRLSLRGPVRGLGLRARQRQTRARLARRGALTAEDWLHAFYEHAPVPFDPFNYFFYRFGQPRHLATLALLSALPPGPRPVLDVACGYGHVLHTVTSRGRAGLGVDQNYHQVWVGRHYVAPAAAFVCADAARRLPLADGAASAGLCADALQHLHDQRRVVGELVRTAGDGPVLFTSVGNLLVGEPDGEERTPEGYAALFGALPWRALSEAALLDRYLAGHGPDLRASSPHRSLAASRFLYYVVDPSEALFREHGAFESWPHAAGAVALNPLYERDGDRHRLRMPSPWFATENGGLRAYMPPSVDLATDSTDALLARAALIGLPQRYARAGGRPWTVAANRALLGAVEQVRGLDSEGRGGGARSGP